jgi:hypothetical protein
VGAFVRSSLSGGLVNARAIYNIEDFVTDELFGVAGMYP